MTRREEIEAAKAQTHWTAKQRNHLRRLIREGATIAYWCSDAYGRPVNTSTDASKSAWAARPGLVQVVSGRPAVHATLTPHRWEGTRVWIVGLLDVARENGGGRARREFVGEVMPEEAMCPSVGVRLGRKDLNGADLSAAELGSADLHIADLVGANLYRARLGNADLRDADLSAADLRGADLSGADLGSASLRGAVLCNADLSSANLRCANLRGADLHGAVLRNADLRSAVLRNANLRIANLRCADLRGVNLRGAALDGANLRDADLDGALFLSDHEAPYGWVNHGGMLKRTVVERIVR